MFIDKDSIVVDGLSLGPYIIEAKFGYHKGWGDDTGRNLDFDFSGTFKGIFPKITVKFGTNLPSSVIKQITAIIDKPKQTLTYDDPSGKKITLSTYTNDYEIVYNSINFNKSFSCSFISRKKRK